MAFQSIESIKVGNFKRGEFAGGFIYSSNFNLGGVESPSTLTLSVVNEGVTSPVTPKYQGLRSGQVHKKGLNIKDKYEIHIGSLTFVMNLVGFSEEKSPELHTMNYEFIDTSHILDRIFIGLPNRHQKPHSKEGAYLVTNLEAVCPDCVSGVVNRKVSASMVALRDAAFCDEALEFAEDYNSPLEYNFQYNPPLRRGNIIDTGGIITLGREEFIDHGSSLFKPVEPYNIPGELPCGVPNVTYKFVDLLAAIEKMDIEITGLPKNWQLGIKDDYRQSYTGTLREVLNNWCADFGYAFTWGIGAKRTLVFTDLTTGISAEFDEVKNFVENAQKATANKTPDQPFLVNNINYSTDMRNTYTSNYLSYYLKPHRPKSFQPFTYYSLKFHCLKLNEVFTPAACGMPGESWTASTMEIFLASCAFAKYSSAARTLFNIQMKRWWAIGVHPTYEFTKEEKDDIFQHLESDNLQAVLYEMEWNRIPNEKMRDRSNWCDAYIAYHDEDQAAAWEEFERSIADEFLGQHYVCNPASGSVKFDLNEFEACLPVLNYKQSIETTPNVEKIVNPSEVPWVKIASKSPAVLAGANAFVASWLSSPKVSQVLYTHVPASWGTLQEQVDAVFNGEDASGEGFNDLETGKIFFDHIFIDSSLFNLASQSAENLEDLLKKLKKDGDTKRDPYAETGLDRLISEARSASISERDRRSTYINKGDVYEVQNDDSRQPTLYKAGEHPKLLVVSPNYISRNPVDNGLGFAFGGIEHNMPNVFASSGSDSPTTVASECSIRCESGLLETMCKCPSDSAVAANFFVGLPAGEKGLLSSAFGILGPHGSGTITFPVNSVPKAFGGNVAFYHGFAKVTASIRALLEGKKLVLDGNRENAAGYERINTELQNLPTNSLGIRVNAKDITNDADMVFQALGSSDNPLDAPASLVKVVVPVKEADSRDQLKHKGAEQMMTLEEYHKRIKSHFEEDSADSSDPSRTLSFSILGNFYDVEYNGKKLSDYLKPEKGLTSLSLNYGSEGIVTNFTFETKRKQLPKLEATMNKIGPTVWKSWYS